MAYITRDFECLKCAHQFIDMVTREEQDKQVCPECGNPARWIISAPKLATYSMMSQDDKAKHLRKRSRDHTRKELKKDPTTARMTKRFKMKGS